MPRKPIVWMIFVTLFCAFAPAEAKPLQTRISYIWSSAKTGGQSREIEIHGDGSVRFVFRRTIDAKPETYPGQVSPDLVRQLLKTLEVKGFFALPEIVPSQSATTNTGIISVNDAKRNHTVHAPLGKSDVFQECLGAIEKLGQSANAEAFQAVFSYVQSNR